VVRRQFRTDVLEQYIMALMLFHDEQAVAINAEFPTQYICANKTRTTILDKIRAYINEHNAAPGSLAEGLFDKELSDGSSDARLIQQELKSLASTYPKLDGPTIEIIRDELAGHLRIRQLEITAQQFLQALEEDPDEALAAFYQRANPVTAGGAGLTPINMLDTPGYFARRREMQQERNQFRFPVPCLEEQWIAPKRGRVMTFAGPTHKGKSHLQRETVFVNLRFHHIMHIYCEHGDDPETEYRMLAYGLTKHPGDRGNRQALTPVTVPHLEVVDGKLSVSYTTRDADCIDNQQTFITEREAQTFAHLHLYRASPLTLTFQMIRKELDRLRQLGINIDIVAIDYPSKMKIDIKRETRLEEARLAMEFSQMCADYNIAGLSISQLNAEGNKAKKPTIYQLNESIDKAFIGDDIILITADEQAIKAQVAYMICGKVKGEEHGQAAAVATCLKIGRFCLDGVIIGNEEVNEVSYMDSDSQLILEAIRTNPLATNAAIAAQLGVSADRVQRISRGLAIAQGVQRPGRGRPPVVRN
jgi:hypothetical protein